MSESMVKKQTRVVGALQDRLLVEVTERVDGDAAQDIRNLAVALGIAWDKLYHRPTNP